MKKKIIKLMVCFLSVFVASMNITTPIHAETNQTRAYIEENTTSVDKGLGTDMGYVTCYVTVKYSSLTNQTTVSKVSVEPHFSILTPFLSLTKYSSTPAVGGTVTGTTVKVNFTVKEGTSGISWNYSCNVPV